MRFSANISLMYADIPFADRAARARDDGFTAVECWWPFPDAAPAANEISAFLTSLDRLGLGLTAMNLYAGDMPAGDRGILSHPDASADFSTSLATLVDITRDSGCRTVNALYGQRLEGVDPSVQDGVALDRLRRAADDLGPVGAQVVVEALTRGQNGAYPLSTLQETLQVTEATGRANVRPLFDAFHLHNNGADVVAEYAAHATAIGHIQVADSPGRGRPGTGGIDFAGLFATIEAADYDGWIGCEYRETELHGVPSV
ncbi:hydroxypyruvate isomerase [Microbacterium ginsengiterrae]|uniref:Hydroxypyruvate isomerase n=1 Tax=Microbacterium ginsengiterrae TaxID=546115 RepID=A0A7W9CCB4_9MICO|nr:TIM barrel protein [Microbacterium ginsengiterrae]MBB5742985.1 hydroxypyruvate isomerase [Microbacterium ginsengiterrae]